MKKFILLTSVLVFGCFSETKSNNGDTTPNTTNTTNNNGNPNNTTQTSNRTTTPKCVPTEEVCDQIDNDCDGKIDEDLGDACCFADSDCGGTICDLQTNTCIQCSDNSLCTEPNASKCGDEKSCVACEVAEDCTHIPGNKAQCDNGSCVVCAGDRDCANEEKCDLEKYVCALCLSDADCGEEKCLVNGDDPTQNSCVKCVANTDCTMVDASNCDDTNTCSGCQSNADCTHLPDTLACNAGSCVECVLDTDCPGTACDLSTNTCSDQTLNTIGQCESCVSDSACLSTHSCILTEFGGASAGAFCLEKKVNSCPRPYSTTITRASVSGAAAAPHCGVNPNLVSCRTVIYAGNRCRLTVPPVPRCPGPGAICHETNLPFEQDICSYSCNNSNECKPGKNCVNEKCER